MNDEAEETPRKSFLFEEAKTEAEKTWNEWYSGRISYPLPSKPGDIVERPKHLVNGLAAYFTAREMQGVLKARDAFVAGFNGK